MNRAALLLAALHAAAATAQTPTRTTAATTTQSTPSTVEEADRSAARYWGLTLPDYRRYQALMRGVRGTISDPRISPIEVLGIHARNDVERRKYAELFARLMAEDTQRVLRFQQAYDQAYRRLNPDVTVVDFGGRARQPSPQAAASLPVVAADKPADAPISRPPPLTAGDRLLLFTRDGCAECDELVQRATPLARAGVAIDLYVVGAGSGEQARRYAQRIALDPGLVSARRVTLNVDGGTFARVLPLQRELPALVRKRGDNLVQLTPTAL